MEHGVAVADPMLRIRRAVVGGSAKEALAGASAHEDGMNSQVH